MIMKTVIFDLFETLITEWEHPKYTTRQIAEALQIDHAAFRQEWEALQKDRYLGRISGTQHVLEHIIKKLNLYITPELIDEIAVKRDANKDLCFKEINDEVISMLKTLKDRGFKLGLISNCSLEEVSCFKTCSIYKYFDAAVLSCEAGMIKPDAEIYEYCLSLLNEKPSAALFVGDGGSNELEGAFKVGLKPLKAAWFIKKHVAVYDIKSNYPVLYSPSDIFAYIEY